jgi:hypothetical protein
MWYGLFILFVIFMPVRVDGADPMNAGQSADAVDSERKPWRCSQSIKLEYRRYKLEEELAQAIKLGNEQEAESLRQEIASISEAMRQYAEKSYS